MVHIIYVLTGIITGIFSGFFGLGGGLVLIPILVYCFGLTQHQAQGTSMAMMIPPVTLLAAIRYYQSGNVKVGMAMFIAAGFIAGGLIGAHYVQHIPVGILRKLFGIIMLLVSLKMIFFK